jgi:AAA ATPase domain
MTAAIGDSSLGALGRTPSLAAGRHVNRLYGRDHELDLLSDLLSRDAGGTLVIRGEPGIGKSALLAAVLARAGEQGIRVLTVVGVQFTPVIEPHTHQWAERLGRGAAVGSRQD